jgi:Ca-activated chloride channel family protein
MENDDSQLYDKWGDPTFSYDPYTLELKLPEDYISPIQNAKVTTKDFVQSFNFKKDFISIIGFSSTVDRVLPLSNNKVKIDSTINLMQADSSTALYDAMLRGLKELNTENGVNVLVTLTDGQNNTSKSDWTDVVNEAISRDIPIFIIGLDNVNKEILRVIADTTNGQFIYTKSSRSFKEIYSKISKQIQAFYDLKYESKNMASINRRRDLIIQFSDNDKDSLTYSVELPEEVLKHLKEKESRREYLLQGSIVTALALTTLSILIYKRRRMGNAPAHS